MSIATVVEWGALLEVLWASAFAGIGVTFAFSLAILGATRAVDLRRDGHNGAASVFVVVMVVGIAATAAATVLGIVVMTAKD